MVKEVSKERKIRKANFGKGPRLYVKGIFTGFRRNKVWTLNNQAILKLEGVNDKKETQYYLGKRVVFIYKAKEGYKTIWGRIRSAHGNNGLVKAKFLHNLPARGIGAQVRVMLYPYKKEAPMNSDSAYTLSRGISKEEFQKRLKVFDKKK